MQCSRAVNCVLLRSAVPSCVLLCSRKIGGLNKENSTSVAVSFDSKSRGDHYSSMPVCLPVQDSLDSLMPITHCNFFGLDWFTEI